MLCKNIDLSTDKTFKKVYLDPITQMFLKSGVQWTPRKGETSIQPESTNW